MLGGGRLRTFSGLGAVNPHRTELKKDALLLMLLLHLGYLASACMHLSLTYPSRPRLTMNETLARHLRRRIEGNSDVILSATSWSYGKDGILGSKKGSELARAGDLNSRRRPVGGLDAPSSVG
eukprot:6176315-Pleurochrysis_carterae.AAC.5